MPANAANAALLPLEIGIYGAARVEKMDLTPEVRRV